MKNSNVHKFENKDWGAFELEIIDPKWSFYQQDKWDQSCFSIKGSGQISIPYTPFYFLEWQQIQYTYVIDKNNSFIPPFELSVNNKTVNTSQEKGNCHLMAGRLSFEDEAGLTHIKLSDTTGKTIFELDTEVFPQKMDYRSDYQAMLTDISAIVQNLAYDALKTTFKKSRARLKGHSTEMEWWNILDALFGQLIINLEVIKKQAKHEIKNGEQILPVEKIRIASKKNVDWLIKNSQYANGTQLGMKLLPNTTYSHALSGKKYTTYNTYENRFITWAVRNIIIRLKRYRKFIDKTAGSRDYSPLINKIQKYQSRLQGLLHTSPFNQAGQFEEKLQFSTTLTSGPGYRDFMHIYMLLTRGLELADSHLFKIELKNISLLYEYWCFLKLVQIIKEQNLSKIDYQDLIQIKANKFYVRLEKGNLSRVSFKKDHNGETTSVYYNKEFRKDGKKVFTYNQKPDYSIEFKKNGFEKPFWYLFDAKYRFENNTANEKEAYSAPQDSIGQLHRYRDAILHTDPNSTSYRTAVRNLGGIILYPYPLTEKAFTENNYYKSIAQFNIGALPFLPGKVALATEFLNNLINTSLPEEHFEESIGLDDSEYIRKRNAWNEFVTIGVIPKKDQGKRMHFLEKNLIYHIPYSRNLKSRLFLSKHLLLCKAGSKEAFLYEVCSWEIKSNEELSAMGTSWQHRDNSYVTFSLKKIKNLETPEKLSPAGFRYVTLEGLNRYLENPAADKKCFYLTTPDGARLYDELCRKNIRFTITWGKNEEDPSLIEFNIDNIKVSSSNTYPDLSFKYQNKIIALAELLKLITS